MSEELITKIERKLDEILNKMEINGNRITVVETEHKAICKEVDELKDTHKWLFRSVIGTGFASVVGIILGLIKYL